MAQDENLSRYQIEADLLAEVEAAQAAYCRSKRRFRQSADLQGILSSGNPDGWYAYHAAAAEQKLALERWSEALRRFDDFVIRGILPKRTAVGSGSGQAE